MLLRSSHCGTSKLIIDESSYRDLVSHFTSDVACTSIRRVAFWLELGSPGEVVEEEEEEEEKEVFTSVVSEAEERALVHLLCLKETAEPLLLQLGGLRARRSSATPAPSACQGEEGEAAAEMQLDLSGRGSIELEELAADFEASDRHLVQKTTQSPPT
eukprot:765976-Hanusia_phi.AAC.5